MITPVSLENLYLAGCLQHKEYLYRFLEPNVSDMEKSPCKLRNITAVVTFALYSINPDFASPPEYQILRIRYLNL